MWNYRNLKETEPRLHALIETCHSILEAGCDLDVNKKHEAAWSKTHDLSEIGTYFGFDTMISMGTGHNPNLMQSSEYRFLPDASLIVSWRALTVCRSASGS